MEEKQWFLYVADHHEGPFDAEEIKKLLKKGEARPTSYVWREGFEDWMMMSDVAEFGVEGSPSGEGHGEPAFLVSKSMPTPATAASNASVSVGDIKPAESVFCLNSNRTFTGPHSLKTLVRKINEGEISIKDTVWREGWTSFVALGEITEVMKDVKASVLNPDLVKSSKKGKSSNVLGLLSKGSNVPRYKFWRGKPFMVLMFLVLPVGGYQLLSNGSALGWFKGTPLENVSLPALPIDGIVDGAIQLGAELPRKLGPVMDIAADYAPEGFEHFFYPFPIVEGISKEKLIEMRDAVRANLADGGAIAAAIPVGDETMPEFHVTTNLPDGTSLRVELRGKKGTLLNAIGFEKSSVLDVYQNYGKSLRFAVDGTKPIPRGEYLLLIYDDEKQTPEVANALADLPRSKVVSSLVPKGRTALLIETVFLGGKKDAVYQAKLTEFNAKLATRKASEAGELHQIVSLIESLSADDLKGVQTLQAVKNAAQKSQLWTQHHTRFTKMIDQLKGNLNKGKEALEKDYILGDLYVKAAELVTLAVAAHGFNAQEINQAGSANLTEMQTTQAKLNAEIAALKAQIEKEATPPPAAAADPAVTNAAPAGAAPSNPGGTQ